MKFFSHFERRRVVAILLLFFITSCFSKSHDPAWVLQKNVTEKHAYNSGKLSYPAQSQFNGIEIELMKSSRDLRLYLNVFTRSIPSASNDPSKALVSLNIAGKQTDFFADRFEGGQRLLLPQNALDTILEALQQDSTIEITLTGYRATISPDRFTKLYSKLMKI